MNQMDQWQSINNNHECGIGKIEEKRDQKRDLEKQKND